MHEEDRKTLEWYLEKPVVWKKTMRIGLTIGLIAALVVLCLLLAKAKENTPISSILSYVGISFGLVSILGYVFASPAVDSETKTIYTHTILFNAQGEIVLQVSPKRTFWAKRWQEFCRDLKTVEFKTGTISVGVKCNPITANPKVRPIALTVTAKSFSTPEELAQQRKRFGTDSAQETENAAQQALARELYDLSEHSSRELSGFFNPLRPEQQETFQKLIFDSLLPFAQANGITLTSATFSL